MGMKMEQCPCPFAEESAEHWRERCGRLKQKGSLVVVGDWSQDERACVVKQPKSTC